MAPRLRRSYRAGTLSPLRSPWARPLKAARIRMASRAASTVPAEAPPAEVAPRQKFWESGVGNTIRYAGPVIMGGGGMVAGFGGWWTAQSTARDLQHRQQLLQQGGNSTARSENGTTQGGGNGQPLAVVVPEPTMSANDTSIIHK